MTLGASSSPHLRAEVGVDAASPLPQALPQSPMSLPLPPLQLPIPQVTPSMSPSSPRLPQDLTPHPLPGPGPISHKLTPAGQLAFSETGALAVLLNNHLVISSTIPLRCL